MANYFKRIVLVNTILRIYSLVCTSVYVRVHVCKAHKCNF